MYYANIFFSFRWSYAINMYMFYYGLHDSTHVNTHSKKYHKYITNILQLYHKYTTKVLQNVILYHKNVILYHKTECFTTKCNILPHSVVFFRNNPTTNCSIPLQNIVIYHIMMYYTMNSSISTTEVIFF